MNELQSVIERLKKADYPFSVHLSRSPISADFFLATNLAENIEHAIYKKQGTEFVIVDFFTDPSKTNKEAADIISTYPRLAAALNYQIECHKQDNTERAE
ncbi:MULTISPECIES: hypothetical protein [Yersinia]|uniref:Uncharacterized protein n=1 Tax=Yersinia frederiksenii TaxID=29484 RepID=A0AAI8ZS00_YERFR|nr:MULTISPECIES: hypothetical protein [Yersinia]MDN0129627.1 hypothetical protein [Yersinia massiliensis]CFR04380.1 Uncharacterised protein [Yersinia frederiksenii]CQH53091.1 Uncharacterised protein [Yersinia frederiksenii]